MAMVGSVRGGTIGCGAACGPDGGRRWWRHLDVSGLPSPSRRGREWRARQTPDPRVNGGCGVWDLYRGRIGGELARVVRETTAFAGLCGGVTVNHRLLADFRGGPRRRALDELFTQG